MSIITLLLQKNKFLLEKRLVSFMQTLPFVEPEKVTVDDFLYVLSELVPYDTVVIQELLKKVESIVWNSSEGEYATITFQQALETKLLIMKKKCLSLVDTIDFHEHMPNHCKDEAELAHLLSLLEVVKKIKHTNGYAFYIETIMLLADLKERVESLKISPLENRILNNVINAIGLYQVAQINSDNLIHQISANYKLIGHSYMSMLAGFFGKPSNPIADRLWEYLDVIKIAQGTDFLNNVASPRRNPSKKM